jgi:hypothetical protein
VPKARLDSSKGVNGTEETMLAAPEDVMDELWVNRPGVEVKMMAPVELVAHGCWRPAPSVLGMVDSRWHEHQWIVMRMTLMEAPQVHMDAMTEVEVDGVVDGM